MLLSHRACRFVVSNAKLHVQRRIRFPPRPSRFIHDSLVAQLQGGRSRDSSIGRYICNIGLRLALQISHQSGAKHLLLEVYYYTRLHQTYLPLKSLLVSTVAPLKVPFNPKLRRLTLGRLASWPPAAPSMVSRCRLRLPGRDRFRNRSSGTKQEMAGNQDAQMPVFFLGFA